MLFYIIPRELDLPLLVFYSELSMRIKLILFQLMILFSPLFAQEEIIDYQPLSNWIDIHEGSSNENQFILYLQDFLDQMNTDYRVVDYGSREDLHSFGQSIEVFRKGTREGHLVVILPLYSESPADLNRFILMLEITRTLLNTEPLADLSLLFLTGENREVPVGSTVYLDRNFLEPDNTGVVYLHTGSNLSSLNLTAGTTGTISSYWFTRSLVDHFQSRGITPHWDTTEMQVHRSGFSEKVPYISPYLEQEISAVLIESDTDDTHLSVRQEDFVYALRDLYLQFHQIDRSSGDRNYFLFRIQEQNVFITENQYLLIYLGAFSLLLFIVLFQFRKILVNIRKYRRKGWMILLSLFLLFLFLLVSTLLMEEALYLLNSPLLWYSSSIYAITIKITLTFIFSSFFLFVIRGMPIPRSPHFYSYNGFIIGILNLLIFSVMDITLTYFWIWIIFLILIFTLTRKSLLKWVSLLLIPVPFVIAIISVMQGEYPKLQDFLIHDRLQGNLFLAMNLLPFLLLLASLHYHRYYYRKERFSLVGPFTLGLSIIATAAIFVLSFTAYRNNQLQNSSIYLTEEVNLNRPSRTQKLVSREPIGDIQLTWPDRSLQLRDLGNQTQIELSPPDDWFFLEQDQWPFLDRVTYNLQLNPIGRPQECRILIRSDMPFTLYNSNYPAEMNASGKEARLLIGRYPPNPLPLELTLNRNSRVQLELEYVYSQWPYILKVESPKATVLEKLLLKTTIPLQY